MNAPAPSLDAASVTVLPPVARFNLRIAPADLVTASEAFGVALPATIGEGAQNGDRSVWRMGPDEWLLHANEADQAAIVSVFDEARVATPHSLTVLSDREITIGVAGAAAVELLSTGCPLDLSRMAVGAAKRTVFDYAQVVLIRDGDDAFRLEVWRSFFPHVHGLLEIATREFTVGT